ncbi:DUF4832 domain-containing protein [uncultured Oscillibacter sp.]|jgi:hypothetical protein|uniref:DUF4832 domain-containing protein n=1 Tax=uncultured Oscillibacter sp. TaxID=876091 RepID=UPI0025F206A1|nr:DUF4832 domain-containing protein [uncultured Oscillibacter sp.]
MSGQKTDAAGSFRGARFVETAEYLPNPGQGWYRIFTYDAAVPFVPEETCLEGDTLALVRVDIGAFRSEPLAGRGLENLRDILRFFDENGVDLILRIAYDFEGKGLEREPELFSQVRRHMLELAPVLGEFQRRVLVFQGLLLGSWGEMHQSKFLLPRWLRELEAAFRSGGNRETWLAVRRPVFLRMLAGPGEFPEGFSARRLCLFNDALGSSETDMGTYGWKERTQAVWEEPWRRDDELAFLEGACAGAPFGGEVLPPESGRLPAWRETAARLRRARLSYLNCRHDRRVLDQWEKTPCRSWRGGPWAGASLYDYVGGRLGFRFLVRRAWVRPLEGGGWHLSVEIENAGFGDLLQEARAELLCRDEGWTRQSLDWDARNWLRGGRTLCEARIPPWRGALYLRLRRRWDGRAILFANRMEEFEAGDFMVFLGTMR